jgi:spore maturation protein CgeB
MGLKIAFFGSSLVSSYWNGAATYYRGIIKALHHNGHDITFYEPDAYDRQKNSDIRDPYYAKVVVYQPLMDEVHKMIKSAAGSDLIIKASGVGVFDNELERMVLENRLPGHTIAFWDVDAPATLERVAENIRDPFRELIPLYDYIFTYGGGDPVINAYKALGAKECIPVYNALDPDTHFPVEQHSGFASDLSFLGNRLPDREERVRMFFGEVARELSHKNFILGGNGWNKDDFTENVKCIGHVPTILHNEFNCSPLALLNICRDSMARFGFSPATRIFEAAGASACIITDHWTGINMFLEPGTEILVAKNGSQVAEILEELTLEKARRIGKAAYQRMLKEHTYSHRAKELEKILNLNKMVTI